MSHVSDEVVHRCKPGRLRLYVPDYVQGLDPCVKHISALPQTEKLNARLPCLSPLGQSAGSGIRTIHAGNACLSCHAGRGASFRDTRCLSMTTSVGVLNMPCRLILHTVQSTTFWHHFSMWSDSACSDGVCTVSSGRRTHAVCNMSGSTWRKEWADAEDGTHIVTLYHDGHVSDEVVHRCRPGRLHLYSSLAVHYAYYAFSFTNVYSYVSHPLYRPPCGLFFADRKCRTTYRGLIHA